MWNPLNKKTGLPDEFINYNSRVHVEQQSAAAIFQANLGLFLSQLYNPRVPFIVLCIGTDRSTGDSLGPLVGSKLKAAGLENVEIYGTLDDPVHAVNLQETLDRIRARHQQSFIVAIDACLGRAESVGFISIKKGPLQPGTGVNKELPAVGNVQIVGIVNVGGFMEYMVLQNTRLSLVMKMAEIIGTSLQKEIPKLGQTAPEKTADFPIAQSNPNTPAPLEPLPY